MTGNYMSQSDLEKIVEMLRCRTRQPKTFEIGQKVRTKGPDTSGFVCEREGRIKLVSTTDNTYFIDGGRGWHPASSLELVEDLEIGDEVEVTGPRINGEKTDIGRRHKISKVKPTYYELDAYRNEMAWPASSLRKIDPTIADAEQELVDQIDKAQSAVRDILAPLVDDRLSGIEKQLARHDKEIGQIIDQGNTNLDDARKQLADQKERMDSLLVDYREFKDTVCRILDRIGSLEAWKAEHAKPRVVVMGGLRHDKMDYISKFLDMPSEVDKFLAGEIKAGDWVQVIRMVVKTSGYIGKVRRIHGNNIPIELDNGLWYNSRELRVLPEDEILSRLNGGQP